MYVPAAIYNICKKWKENASCQVTVAPKAQLAQTGAASTFPANAKANLASD